MRWVRGLWPPCPRGRARWPSRVRVSFPPSRPLGCGGFAPRTPGAVLRAVRVSRACRSPRVRALSRPPALCGCGGFAPHTPWRRCAPWGFSRCGHLGQARAVPCPGHAGLRWARAFRALGCAGPLPGAGCLPLGVPRGSGPCPASGGRGPSGLTSSRPAAWSVLSGWAGFCRRSSAGATLHGPSAPDGHGPPSRAWRGAGNGREGGTSTCPGHRRPGRMGGRAPESAPRPAPDGGAARAGGWERHLPGPRATRADGHPRPQGTPAGCWKAGRLPGPRACRTGGQP